MAKKLRKGDQASRKPRSPIRKSDADRAPAKPSAMKPAAPDGSTTGPVNGRFPIVGLGASAGGLEAFTRFLKALPSDTGMGFVLIQHMDPTHESILANLLQRSTKMPIREAGDGTVVEPNRVYIAPPNALMTISGGVLSLTSRGPRSFQDYPIDQFFASLAQDVKHRAIGVVLSGAATDGTRGLLAIKAAGGITFAQDTESAQYSSMPASAVASGCVDFTLSPDQIAQELSRVNGHPYIQREPATETAAAPAAGDGLRKILRQLRNATGVDFELYKPAMIGRRIARRMALQKLNTHEQYLELIKKDRAELNALYEDIFIHVTGFFRDPESLQALQKRVLSNFVPGKTSRNIRIWIPGCSTGEEVYSIAMLLFETLGERGSGAGIQIFGTDISDRSVQKARAGIYPASSIMDVSLERQRRFLSHIDATYQIKKAIRDVCVFARHDLSKDPPFSRIDLISCRNVLIYMGPTMQKKVIDSFHYALKPGGYLLLGKSESLSAYSDLFGTEDPKHKILVRRPFKGPAQLHAGAPERAEAEKASAAVRPEPPVSEIRREAERLLLDRYTPAALVVDSNLQIVHFQGDTGRFLAPASGEPSFHLLRMIRPELLVDMRSVIYQAKRKNAAAHKDGIRLEQNGEAAFVDIHVSPIKARHAKDQDYLVVFQENLTRAPLQKKAAESPKTAKDQTKAELSRRESEIAALREQLQDLVHDHEAADEEVRSMNEEILSSNEELQSTNEELETAKEELESTNEELTTLNDELQKRNSDLSQLTDDLTNVLVGTDIPLVILDKELRIRRFTPAAGKALNLISTDIGRPLSDLASTLPSVNWQRLAAQVIEKAEPFESEVQDREGRWHTLRLRPYRSSAERVDGILIALVNVDIMKRSMEEADQARRRAQDLEARLTLAGEGLRIGMWEYDLASGTIRGSKQWATLYGFAPYDVATREQWLQRVHPEDRAMALEDLEQISTSGQSTSRDYRILWPDGTTHWLNGRAELVRDDKGNPARIRGVSIDITEQKLVENERQAFSSRIASAQELERRRIARELHDGLIQELAAMAMDLGRRVKESPASHQLKSDYRQLQNRVVKAAEAARHVAYELHPTELDDLGLEKALRAYCGELGREHSIAIEFSSRGLPRELKREIASCLYKVAQEALRNVVKHSKAKSASVTLDTDDTRARLRVEDSGAGFQLASLQGANGLGVASMRERVQLVNGKFVIFSEPGKGTKVVTEVPLARSAPTNDNG